MFGLVNEITILRLLSQIVKYTVILISIFGEAYFLMTIESLSFMFYYLCTGNLSIELPKVALYYCTHLESVSLSNASDVLNPNEFRGDFPVKPLNNLMANL